MEIRENAGENQENVHARVDLSENMLNSGYFIAALQQISTAPPPPLLSESIRPVRLCSGEPIRSYFNIAYLLL